MLIKPEFSVCALFTGLYTPFQEAINKFDMSCYLKWNVSNANWDRSCCPLTHGSDLTAPDSNTLIIFALSLRCKGGEVDATEMLVYPFNPERDQLQDFHFLWIKSQGGEQEGAGSLCKKSFRQWRGRDTSPLSESWYELNPFTVYIFTSTALLSTQ